MHFNTYASSIRRLVAACAFTLAAAASAPVIAGPTNVPFRADLSTIEVLSVDSARCPALPFLVGTTSGSGNATHLGRVTGIATDCITPLSQTTSNFTDGRLTLYTASGDEVRLVYTGYIAATGTSSISSVAGNYRIVGGTGNFENATGSGTISGVLNMLTNHGSLRFQGTISY